MIRLGRTRPDNFKITDHAAVREHFHRFDVCAQLLEELDHLCERVIDETNINRSLTSGNDALHSRGTGYESVVADGERPALDHPLRKTGSDISPGGRARQGMHSVLNAIRI